MCDCFPGLSAPALSVFISVGLRVAVVEDEAREGLQELETGSGKEESLGEQPSRHTRAQQRKSHF